MKRLVALLLALAGLVVLLASCAGGEEEGTPELIGTPVTPTLSPASKATPTPPPAPMLTATPEAAEPFPDFTPRPTETPAPESTPAAQPEPTEILSPEPMETPMPTPEGQQVRAEGKAYWYKTSDRLGLDVLENEVWLEFNTGGGPVKGEARVRTAGPSRLEECSQERVKYVLDVWYEGTYSTDSNEFGGTYEFEEELLSYVADEETGKCKADAWFDYGSGEWQATLADGVVVGWVGAGGAHSFQLTAD